MVKVSIKTPTIGLRPSDQLINFIKSLDDSSIALPENLLNIYQAFTQDTKSRLVYKEPIPEYTFTDEERNLLIALSDDAFQNTTDLEKTLTELCIGGSNEDENDSDTETVTSSEPISKNKARQNRAKQRQKELSHLMLNLTDLKWIHKYLSDIRENDPSVGYLHELIKGSHLILPANEFTERDPELEARCQRLKREQDDQTYRSMTKNVDCSRTYEPEETIAYQVKQINRQLIAVLQFIFSVAAGFAFGFIGVELIVGDLDFGFRLLLGIICSLIIALAEIYFLAKKLNEDLDEHEQLKLLAANAAKAENASKAENLKEHND